MCRGCFSSVSSELAHRQSSSTRRLICGGLKMMNMDHSTGNKPWLTMPIRFHSDRNSYKCKLTPEQCAYQTGHWRFWYVLHELLSASKLTCGLMQVPSRSCLFPEHHLPLLCYHRRFHHCQYPRPICPRKAQAKQNMAGYCFCVSISVIPGIPSPHDSILVSILGCHVAGSCGSYLLLR